MIYICRATSSTYRFLTQISQIPCLQIPTPASFTLYCEVWWFGHPWEGVWCSVAGKLFPKLEKYREKGDRVRSRRTLSQFCTKSLHNIWGKLCASSKNVPCSFATTIPSSPSTVDRTGQVELNYILRFEAFQELKYQIWGLEVNSQSLPTLYVEHTHQTIPFKTIPYTLHYKLIVHPCTNNQTNKCDITCRSTSMSQNMLPLLFVCLLRALHASVALSCMEDFAVIERNSCGCDTVALDR